jgi:mono/diheme cytochrome c family protein
MAEPFQPEPAASALSAPVVTVLDPLAAAGKKVYENESCDACHGTSGVGTEAGPKLAGDTSNKSPEQLTHILRQPTKEMARWRHAAC